MIPTPRALAQTPGRSWVEKASASVPATGQKRLALILGNTHYGGENGLKNPENDARDIAKTLGTLGFTSTVLLDGSLDQMSDAVHAFADAIRAAGSGSVAMLYYSGHGIQVNGENYLVPIGFAMPTNDRDMGRHALSAQTALDEMQGANARVNIAVPDACRDNPFATKGRSLGGGRGLAKLEAAGMLIAYATAAGTTASDNAGGRNGLYTASLLTFLRKPGMPLNTVFSRTRKAVYEASGKKQFPYVYDGLIDGDEFCLMPGDAAPAPHPVTEAANASVLDTTARLMVTTNVPGATVMVNDAPVADGEYAVDLGLTKEKTVEVDIAADGYKASGRTVKLLRGKMVTLPVVLAALPSKPIVPYVPPPTSKSTLGVFMALRPKPDMPVESADVIKAVALEQFVPPLTLARYKSQMVMVPVGEFTMGSDGHEGDEKPAHKVTLSAYRIGKTAVTVGMWQELCKATKRRMPPEPAFNLGWAKKDHPVVNVSWEDAQAYCAWADVKLPTEAQWEKAARGIDGREYPWGNEFDATNLWCSKAKQGDARGTREAGYFLAGASPYGCLDMAGNVWQWCEDRYDGGFYTSYRATETDPVNEAAGETRILRGGSGYISIPGYFRSALRNGSSPTTRDDYFGFRAVLTGRP